MWGMVVTSTFDLLWPYPTCQHTGPRIVCNVGGRLVPHRNRREKFVFRRQSERAQAESSELGSVVKRDKNMERFRAWDLVSFFSQKNKPEETPT